MARVKPTVKSTTTTTTTTSQRPAINEAEILKATTIADEDKWPIFKLYEVIVQRTGSESLESLLHADAAYPVVVTGLLKDVDEEYKDQGSFFPASVLFCALTWLDSGCF